MRKLGMIVATDVNGIIGKAGKLPWHVPEDLQHFKQTTMGHSVIMGRKTWESLRHPLVDRQNIVMSKRPGYTAPGATVTSSFEDALDFAYMIDEMPFVIGGAKIFEIAMPKITDLYLTIVLAHHDGDTMLPPMIGPWEKAETHKILSRDPYTIVQHLVRI